MPNKHPEKKEWKLPKQKYKASNWHDYNNALRQRGNIEIWTTDDVIKSWHESEIPGEFFNIDISTEIRRC